MEYARQVAGHRQRENPRHDDPTEETTHEPISFPSPVFHPAIGDVETGGSESTHPVQEHP